MSAASATTPKHSPAPTGVVPPPPAKAPPPADVLRRSRVVVFAVVSLPAMRSHTNPATGNLVVESQGVECV